MRRHAWTTVAPLCIAALLLISAQANGDVTLTFNTPGFEWFHPSGSATPYHIWVTGDYWAQTFSATGQSSAGEMKLHLFIDDNILSSGDAVNLDVLLNTNNVGTISVASGVSGALNFDFTFPEIAGPNYRIQLLETNTIPTGHGSVSIGLGERSYATLSTAIPAPPAVLLGLIGCAVVARVKRRFG